MHQSEGATLAQVAPLPLHTAPAFYSPPLVSKPPKASGLSSTVTPGLQVTIDPSPSAPAATLQAMPLDSHTAMLALAPATATAPNHQSAYRGQPHDQQVGLGLALAPSCASNQAAVAARAPAPAPTHASAQKQHNASSAGLESTGGGSYSYSDLSKASAAPPVSDASATFAQQFPPVPQLVSTDPSAAEPVQEFPNTTPIVPIVPLKIYDPYVASPGSGSLSPRSFAGVEPLVNYSYGNTSLLADYGSPTSSSSSLFHFTNFPPRRLEESFVRTRMADDPEEGLPGSRAYGYQATPADLEEFRRQTAARVAEEERRARRWEARMLARQELRGSPAMVTVPFRTPSASMPRPIARPSPRPQVKTLPRQTTRLPQPKRPKNMATQTRFKRALAVSLFPETAQPDRLINLSHVPTFFNLLDLPPEYIYSTEATPPPPSPQKPRVPSSVGTHPVELYPLADPSAAEPVSAPRMSRSVSTSLSVFDSPAPQGYINVDSPHVSSSTGGTPIFDSPKVESSRFDSVPSPQVDSRHRDSLPTSESIEVDSNPIDAIAPIAPAPAAPVALAAEPQAEIPDWIKALNAAPGLDDWTMDSEKGYQQAEETVASPAAPPLAVGLESMPTKLSDFPINSSALPFDLAALFDSTNNSVPFPTPTSLLDSQPFPSYDGNAPVDLGELDIAPTYGLTVAPPQQQHDRSSTGLSNFDSPRLPAIVDSASATPGLDTASASPAPVAIATPTSNGKPKPKAKRARATDDDSGKKKKKTKEAASAVIKMELDPETGAYYQVQPTSCLAKRCEGKSRCFQCIARNVGAGGCRFQDIRSFTIDQSGNLLEAGKFRDTTEADDQPYFGRPLSSPYTSQHGEWIRTAIAPYLVAILERELAHSSLSETKRMRLNIKTSHVCDTCLHISVGGDWICSSCGRSSCHNCRAELVELVSKEREGGAAAAIALASSTPEHQRRRKCGTKKRGASNADAGHTIESFTPLTWLDKTGLEATIAQAKAWAAAHPSPAAVAAVPLDQLARYLCRDPILPSERPILVIPAADLSEPLFHQLWEAAEPLVVDQVDLQYVGAWTPQYFAEHFGDVRCDLVNHKSLETAPSLLSYFFGLYGQPKPDSKSWKLKAFPESGFASHPEYLASYLHTIPLGDLLRPDGVLNLIAHAPVDAPRTEVGPRNGFSWAGRGSTMLHMEATDVMNLMTWSSLTTVGVPGSARYDVYRPEDAETIRSYIFDQLSRKMHKGVSGQTYRQSHDDPLLAENVYLDPDLRDEIFNLHGIKPFTFYQRPGQFVMIPAGCAYQVTNYDDCLNISHSFLSRQSLARSLQIYAESRRQTKERNLWRHDTVQLENQLLWSWKSVDDLDNPSPPPQVQQAAPAPVVAKTSKRAKKTEVDDDWVPS